MGLGDTDLSNDEGGTASICLSAMVSCSICLEAVTDGGDRSTAKLQCGHDFHLDCIGSAFNAKGVMQCPNCRKVEKGNWLYANGCRSFPESFPEISMGDLTHDEDLYDLNYSDMPFGVHWCPFSRLARAPSSFEEGGESSPAIAFHDLSGHHAIFPEHPATTLAAHSCPYVAYFRPLQPSTSLNSNLSAESLVDGPAYHRHWSVLSVPLDIQARALPAIDLHYHGWEHHSSYSQPSSHSNAADQASATTRAGRLDSDGLPWGGSLNNPFTFRHGPGSRAGNSFVSSMVPPFFGNSRSQAHVYEHYQHHNTLGLHGPVFADARRSGGMRGMAPVAPTTPSPSDNTSFYVFPPPTGPSSRNIQDVENPGGNQFYAWERDRFAPYPLLPVDRESAWWDPFPQNAGMSDSGRRGFWHRHGSEMSSSQGRSEGSSHRPIHLPRMHSFI